MKIILISNSVNGIIRFRIELLQTLVRTGHEVISLLPHDDRKAVIEAAGVQVKEIAIERRGVNPFADLSLFSILYRTIKKEKPDVVLTYTIKPNVYGGLACRLTKTPYLPNVTGLGTSIESGGILSKISLLLYKVALKKAQCVFFQNESNMLFFKEKKITKQRMKVIPGSGVNLEKNPFEQYPNDDNIVKAVYIGRVMKAKGIDEFIQAAEEFRQNTRKIEFHVLGYCEEDYLPKLKNLEANDVITYHGEQNDVHSYIKRSHVTIQPSHHEGTSNVLLETAASGRPILASDIPGCRETFEEGVSGLGFEVKNSQSLIRTINHFLSLTYEEKKKMGFEGRKKMEREYDRNIVTNSYLEEINRIT